VAATPDKVGFGMIAAIVKSSSSAANLVGCCREWSRLACRGSVLAGGDANTGLLVERL
jgi:hypothetical protein